MTADLTALNHTTAGALDLLLLADEAEEAGAWEETAWLRLRAAGRGCRLPREERAEGVIHWHEDAVAVVLPGGYVMAGPLRASVGVAFNHALPEPGPEYWYSSPVPCWCVLGHRAGGLDYPVEPPPQVRRLVEAAAGEAVRRVLAAEGVTGAAPGA